MSQDKLALIELLRKAKKMPDVQWLCVGICAHSFAGGYCRDCVKPIIFTEM